MTRWLPGAGVLGVATAVAWHRWVTPWPEQWGATGDEVRAARGQGSRRARPAEQRIVAVREGWMLEPLLQFGVAAPADELSGG